MEIPFNQAELPITALESVETTMGTVNNKNELNSVETAVPTGRKEKALEKAGATRAIAYKTMVSALEAETMTLDKYGEEHTAPDHSSRLKAAELISRLNGDLKAETVIDNRVVNIQGVPQEVLTGLLNMVKDVSEQLVALRTSGQQTGEIIDVHVE